MAHDPAKLLSLNTFINLVALPLIAPEPPAWDHAYPVPDKRARLKAFAGAYRTHQANPATAHDFPKFNTRQAWLDSFSAYERIVMVALAMERREAEGTTETVEEPESETPLASTDPLNFPSEADRQDGSAFHHANAAEAPELYAGGTSGGAGGGGSYDPVYDEPAPAPMQAEAPDPVTPDPEPAPLESSSVDPVGSLPADTSDQSDR